MHVEELMSTPRCCSPTDSVIECSGLMRTENIGFVPICNEAGEPVGTVTDRDLVIRVLAEGRSPDEEIQAFMTRDVVACRVGDDLRTAERLMRERRTSRVMVCDDRGQLKGVISLADIADADSERAVGEVVHDVKSDQPARH